VSSGKRAAGSSLPGAKDMMPSVKRTALSALFFILRAEAWRSSALSLGRNNKVRAEARCLEARVDMITTTTSNMTPSCPQP
jgi:hypothetical protein